MANWGHNGRSVFHSHHGLGFYICFNHPPITRIHQMALTELSPSQLNCRCDTGAKGWLAALKSIKNTEKRRYDLLRKVFAWVILFANVSDYGNGWEKGEDLGSSRTCQTIQNRRKFIYLEDSRATRVQGFMGPAWGRCKIARTRKMVELR